MPPSGSNRFLYDERVPADTLKVFVGGNAVLPDGTLAETNNPGAIPQFGSAAWNSTVSYRGQLGASRSPATDYGPWGTVIMFNADAGEVAWHSGQTIEGLEPHEFDLLTVAMHELMHAFGFGPSESFEALTETTSAGLQFAGPQTLAISQAETTNVDLVLHGPGHWHLDTFGLVEDRRQRALMVPIINPGGRLYPTSLDRAALRDVGWQEGQPGDANLNGRFDMFDLVQVLQEGKYNTSATVGWAQGNWNGDAVFNQYDVVAALVTGNFLQGPYAALTPDHQSIDEVASIIEEASTRELLVGSPVGSAIESEFMSTRPGLSQVFVTRDRADARALFGGGAIGDADLIYVPEPSAATALGVGLALILFSGCAAGRTSLRQHGSSTVK